MSQKNLIKLVESTFLRSDKNEINIDNVDSEYEANKLLMRQINIKYTIY
jgi:hypothetical protein